MQYIFQIPARLRWQSEILGNINFFCSKLSKSLLEAFMDLVTICNLVYKTFLDVFWTLFWMLFWTLFWNFFWTLWMLFWAHFWTICWRLLLIFSNASVNTIMEAFKRLLGTIFGNVLTYFVFKYVFTKVWILEQVISERWNSDELNTFTTYLSSLLGVIAIVFSNHAQKWGQICCKSVQLVRGSSFRNDLLQNPYFSCCPT